MEEFCDKTFSPLVIRGSDDGTKLNDEGEKKNNGRIQFWCAHGSVSYTHLTLPTICSV